ncbi:MAG TPA: hypothetical protein VJA27_03385 [Patescibacteria group bacterium]|nr:hypothetical protein [Patescibacteria group bacterium]
MKRVLQLFLYSLGVGGIFFLHAVLFTIAPFPLNSINSIFVAMIWLMLYTNTARVLWLVIPFALLTEIFSSLPFGFQSIALFTSLTIVNFLLVNFFTNRSVYIIFFIGLSSVFTYHVLLRFMLFVHSLITKTVFTLPRQMLFSIMSEVLLTSLVLVLLYLLTARRLKRLNPTYLSSF